MLKAIPEGALDKHVAILGKTGSGKTNAAKVTIERLLKSGERVCVIDPTGAWWGLRSNAAGDGPGYPVVVFGGAHGDLPLSGQHGAAIAEIVGTSSTPAVIDTRLMTVGDRTRFFTDFAEALLRKNKGPLHLVMDEAHLFAPQGKINDPQSGKMVGAANNLVSLGRGIGLRIIMISQRPAKLHKDSLTQVETLVAMRLIAPQDRRAVQDWVGEWADPKDGRELIASLPSLPTGQAWIWSPEMGVLSRAAFPLTTTFDSGKAPAGDGDDGPVLAPIDVDAVQARLEVVAKDAIENDPKRLKAEIASLKRQMAGMQRKVVADPAFEQEAEQRGYERGWRDGANAGAADGAAAQMRLVHEALGRLGSAEVGPSTSIIDSRPPLRTSPPPAERRSISAKKANGSTPHSPDRPLAAERRPLAVLASVFPAGMTEAQWAVAAGLKRTGGTWSTYVSRLRSAGRIERDGSLYLATQSGIDDLGEVVEPLPSPGPDLVEFWASRISGAHKLLRHLAGEYPDWTTRQDLAEALSLAADGGTFSTYLSRLRAPGLIEEDGVKRLRAARDLMEA